jgi:methylated-DNA-[protein]-cysteine S-methyltransferase
VWRFCASEVGVEHADNPLAIIVPCHRVLRTDGGLGGYRGGMDAKQALLDHERGYRASRQAPEA